MSLQDEVARITEVTVTGHPKESPEKESPEVVGEKGAERLIAEGGLCTPITRRYILPPDSKYVITYGVETSAEASAEASREKPPVCECVRISAYQLAAQGKFCIPMTDEGGVPGDARQKLEETTCTKCGQMYLLAEWDDLLTGLLLK